MTTEEVSALLHAYGFDHAEFERLRAEVSAGTLSKSATVLREPIEPAQPRDIDVLPDIANDQGRQLATMGREALRLGKVGVVVVAGGMATRFGGGAKAVVDVVEKLSFIGLTLRDLELAGKKYGHPVPLGIMTSFATHDAIEKHLAERKLSRPGVELFRQGISQRLTPKGELFRGADGLPSLYAPGHGDFFRAIKKRPSPGSDSMTLLERWRKLDTIFFHNVDNQGAMVSTDEFSVILGLHLMSGHDMTIEVVPKREGDAGGVVARVNGRLRGVEGFRLTGDQSVFTDFSPNNILFKREALLRDIQLEHHFVEKKVEGQTVVQLEQVTLEASGAMRDGNPVLSFGAIRVPGSRFLPVKEPADLEKLREALKGPLGRAYELD